MQNDILMQPTDQLIHLLGENIPGCVKNAINRFGILEIEIAGHLIETVVTYLKDDPALQFNMLIDMAGLDYLDLFSGTKNVDRFAVVYHLKSLNYEKRISLRVSISELDPSIPTISRLFKNADWLEREVYDQFGINFIGHSNLRRILNHHQFVGHPLRKDYPITQRQILTVSDSLTDQMDIKLNAKGYVNGLVSEKRPQKNDLNDSSGLHWSSLPEKEDLLLVNVGPSHPATHGTLRLLCAMNGETIVAAVPEIGYLHRGFEKDCEIHPFQQVIPYTDRLNYLSAIMNNVGYAKTVERMMAISIPDRAILIRMVTCELNRIIDHLVCLGTNLVDLGALTNFWYAWNTREKVYNILEKLCGARLTSSYIRIGGLAHDAYDGFENDVRNVTKDIEYAVKDIESLIKKNKIFLDRTMDICIIAKEDAIAYGWTGPTLRACGVEYDLRKAEPYYFYDLMDFDIPVGTKGDTFDRIFIRVYEIHESIRIISQSLSRLKPGLVMTENKEVSIPPKSQTYGNIEGLMNHFKIIMHGICPEPGEIYDATEAANGELGFHIVSDGSKNPYRIKCRAPSFMNFAAFPEMIEGVMLADAIATLGSINIIAGELDR